MKSDATTPAPSAMTENDGAEFHDIVTDLREFASNSGYSHADYADTMRKAANCIEMLRARFWGVDVAALQQRQAPAQAADTRQQFEAWARRECGMTDESLGLRESGHYAWGRTCDMFEAWSAALAQQAEAAPAPTADDPEYLAMRLKRVARAAGVPVYDKWTNEQVAEAAVTILGDIARKLEVAQAAAAVPIAKDEQQEPCGWLAGSGTSMAEDMFYRLKDAQEECDRHNDFERLRSDFAPENLRAPEPVYRGAPAVALPAAPELPPLPAHPEPRVMRWSELEKRAISEYGKACASAASRAMPAPKLTDEQWIFDLAAEYEAKGNGLYGPVTFSADGLVKFVRAALADPQPQQKEGEA